MPPRTRTPSRAAAPDHGLVVFAKNKKRVSAFYQATLSLRLAASEPSHDRLLGPGFELVIHTIPRRYAVGITIARPPVPREDSAFKPMFVVQDLERVRIAARRSGGQLAPSDRAWRLSGWIVLDGWDPEGNIVQFKQRADDTVKRLPDTTPAATTRQGTRRRSPDRVGNSDH